jgi:CTP synthase (UTP-ammonia lyase)
VIGIPDADHEETAPGSSSLIISKLSCSLVGKTEKVRIIPGSLSHQAYRQEEVSEQFACNYGLNREYREKVEQGGIRVSGVDMDGDVRIVELTTHRFFVATLFLPQLLSRPDRPHPLITAYVKAALSFSSRWASSHVKKSR